MGVGWGGAESCYSILPEPKALLSLIGLAETRPIGTSDHSDFHLLVTVMKDAVPVAGAQVGFAVSVTPNSGSHEHHDSSRSQGGLNITSGTTNLNGEIRLNFLAPEVSGIHTVTATCTAT